MMTKEEIILKCSEEFEAHYNRMEDYLGKFLPYDIKKTPPGIFVEIGNMYAAYMTVVTRLPYKYTREVNIAREFQDMITEKLADQWSKWSVSIPDKYQPLIAIGYGLILDNEDLRNTMVEMTLDTSTKGRKLVLEFFAELGNTIENLDSPDNIIPNLPPNPVMN